MSGGSLRCLISLVDRCDWCDRIRLSGIAIQDVDVLLDLFDMVFARSTENNGLDLSLSANILDGFTRPDRAGSHHRHRHRSEFARRNEFLI